MKKIDWKEVLIVIPFTLIYPLMIWGAYSLARWIYLGEYFEGSLKAFLVFVTSAFIVLFTILSVIIIVMQYILCTKEFEEFKEKQGLDSS